MRKCGKIMSPRININTDISEADDSSRHFRAFFVTSTRIRFLTYIYVQIKRFPLHCPICTWIKSRPSGFCFCKFALLLFKGSRIHGAKIGSVGFCYLRQWETLAGLAWSETPNWYSMYYAFECPVWKETGFLELKLVE